MTRARTFTLTVLLLSGFVAGCSDSEPGDRAATAPAPSAPLDFRLDRPAEPDPVATGLNPAHGLAVYNVAMHNLAVSPDGRRLAGGDGSGSVYLWNTATGALEHAIEAHDDWAFSVAFHPDGAHFATAGGDNLVHLYTLADPPVRLRTFTGHEADVHAVAFTPDGRRLISAGDDRTAIIWNTDSGERLHTLRGHEKQVPALAVSPDGRMVATASRDGTVNLWTIDTGERLRTLPWHERDVMSVRFTPDGARVVTAAYDAKVRIYDITAAENIYEFDQLGEPGVWVDISPDGRRVVGVGTSKAIVWDLDTGAVVATIGPTEEVTWTQLAAAVYLPADTDRPLCIAVSTTDGFVHLYDAASFTHVRTLHSPAFNTRRIDAPSPP